MEGKGEEKTHFSILSGPWKVPMLGGPWKVPMFGGQWKEKEKHLFPMLSGLWKVLMCGGQWKEKEKEKEKHPFQCLVALGRFQCLVANGRKRRNTFSPFLTFPPIILLKPSFFPLILRFYFIMVLGHYLCISFLFLDL